MDRRETMVQVGDVIVSPLLAPGHRQDDDGRLWVGQVFGDDKLGPFHDASRATARFVVEESGWTGPTADDCWLVKAIRLHPDGSFDPDGQRVAFYQRGDYTTPYIDEVEIVGRMRRIVSFV